MSDQDDLKNKFKQFGRKVFALQPPYILHVAESSFIFSACESQSEALRLYQETQEPLHISLCDPPQDWWVDPCLNAPEQYRIDSTCLLDIPGMYQFAGNLLLNKPKHYSGEFSFSPPRLKDLSSVLGDWEKPIVQNMFLLLIGKPEPFLDPLPEYDPPLNFRLEEAEQQMVDTGFLMPDILDVTSDIAPKLEKPTLEDMIRLLAGEEASSPEPPELYYYPGTIFLMPETEDVTANAAWMLEKPAQEDMIRLLAGEEALSPEAPDLYYYPESIWFVFPQQLLYEFRKDLPEQIDITPTLALFTSTDSPLAFAFPIPAQVNLTGLDSFKWPPVVVENVFQLLTKARCAGKDYDSRGNLIDESSAGSPLLEEPLSDASAKICIHGLAENTCDICIERLYGFQKYKSATERRSRRAGPLPKVINPFDLLLPYLSPPIDANFNSALIFPTNKTLYDFQKTGIKFLLEKESSSLITGKELRKLLADEMGLGKSIQAIFAMRLLFRFNKTIGKALIICPKSVLKDWERKLLEWAPELRVLVISGMPEIRAALWQTPAHVYLAGYDTLAGDINQLSNVKFMLAIVDEIQNIKNPKAEKTKAVRRINAEHRWGLSATPLENKIEDLISIFAYLKPKLLTYEDAGDEEKVKQIIRPYFLRRRMKDVRQDLELEDPIHKEVWLELTPAQRKTYEQVVADARRSLKPVAEQIGSLRKGSEIIQARRQVLAQISQLKQICNFDPETGESSKADYLKDKLLALSQNNDKALVFSQYPQVSLKPLANRLKYLKPQVFDGTLTDKERNKIIDAFQEQNLTSILLMSVKTGGVGITLTRANHVFFLDHWWNPAVNKQAEGRVFRIGQEKTVFITSLYMANTIEEKIRDLLNKKQKLFDNIIDEQSETTYDSITIEELLDLFDLVDFDVILVNPGVEVGTLIKIIRELNGLDYEEARKLVQLTPSTVLTKVPGHVADKAKLRLETIRGCRVEIRPRQKW